MGTWRYTIEILRSGQSRAYGDTITHGRITFEINYYGPDKEKHGSLVKSTFVKEDRVRQVLKGIGHGFTEFRYPEDCQDPAKPTADEWFKTRLNWLREIEPGVWEYHTQAVYTD